MSELNHTNDIAVAILKNEYADYDENYWHYNREYKMLVKAQTEAWKQANEAAEQQEKGLNKHRVSDSINCQHPFSQVKEISDKVHYCKVCDKFI